MTFNEFNAKLKSSKMQGITSLTEKETEYIYSVFYRLYYKEHIELREILYYVCVYFCVDEKELISKNRKTSIMIPRHVYSITARLRTRNYLTKIGKQINRDHATVLHSISLYTKGDTLIKPKVDEFLNYLDQNRPKEHGSEKIKV